MAEWLGCWTCNLLVPGLSPPPCYPLDFFLVALSSTPWLHCVSSQLICPPASRDFQALYVYLRHLFLSLHV